MAIPTGANVDSYLQGRAAGLYQGQQPLANPPPVGTPAWWFNEGISDAVNGYPSKLGRDLPAPAGTQPAGVGYPPPRPESVRIPSWADDYWAAYLWALQDPGTAAQRVAQSNWTPNYHMGLVDGLAKVAPKDPSGFYPTATQLAFYPPTFQIPTGTGGPVIRTAPPAPPPRGGGVYIPPPPLPPPGPPPPPVNSVQATFEIYAVGGGGRGFGRGRGRGATELREALHFDGRLYRAKPGYQIMVGVRPSDGFGLGGRPGSWPQLYPTHSPADYGLDSDKGVVEMDSGRGRAIAASDLVEIFGPNWRSQVYGTVGTGLPSPYEGMLIKGNVQPPIYLVQGGAKSWIANINVFNNRGYQLAQVQTVDESIISQIPDGPPITS